MKYLILLSLIGTTWACSCFPMSDDKKYCEADFVMKMKIKSELIIPGRRNYQSFDAYYKIRPFKRNAWKLENGDAVRKWRRLYTGSNSAMCGVGPLIPGTKYLIAGSIDTYSGKLRVNSCSSFIRRTPVESYKSWKKNPPDCDNLPASSSPMMFFK